MFHIQKKIGLSNIHGRGIFAIQKISKGNPIYTANLDLDTFLPEKEFESLSQDEQETMKHYGYFDDTLQKWHLAFDDIRFCNHSGEGNMTWNGNTLLAKKDIEINEELTQNYAEFETLRKELR
jgi:hypothetical protein